MELTDQDRTRLLNIARQAVDASVAGQQLPPAPTEGVLGEQRGCFVTLTNGGRLRGCIGNFQPDLPLGPMVQQMAVAAATQDPRFVTDRITPAELPDLTVEVSVLSELTETDDPESLIPGEHGIFVVGKGRSGCFLPEVAADQGWNAEQFLSYCCAHKAGLPPEAWRDEDVTVYLFTSEKFKE